MMQTKTKKPQKQYTNASRLYTGNHTTSKYQRSSHFHVKNNINNKTNTQENKQTKNALSHTNCKC